MAADCRAPELVQRPRTSQRRVAWKSGSAPAFTGIGTRVNEESPNPAATTTLSTGGRCFLWEKATETAIKWLQTAGNTFQ